VTFIETTEFTQQVVQLLEDIHYAEFQEELWENPHWGKVIPGCGGLRKVRVSDPQRHKGKRSGLRIIYLFVPEVEAILFLDIYGKAEKDDLTSAEKKILKRLAQQLKQQVLEGLRPGEGEVE